MISIWEQPWFWPALAVVVGLPILLLVLTEIAAVLERTGRAASARLVRFARNWILPSAALLVVVLLATAGSGAKPDFTWARLVATLFGFLAIVFVLNGVNLALFATAREGSWRERLPSIFIDIARILLVIVGLAVLFQIVWSADVAGFFTALGVTSIVVGLALQNAAGSVVSGLLLLFEQPFRIGDWLDAGGVRGRVVEVNWRAVHIDTGEGLVIMPNASLAGSSFTNLSRTDGAFGVTVPVAFTTDDPPAAVKALLIGVASGLPQLVTGSRPTATALGGTAYAVSFDVPGPAAEGAATDVFRTWLWYAARRAGLGLDGDTTDDFVTPERTRASLERVAPLLQVPPGSEDVDALLPRVRLRRYAEGETVMPAGTVPSSVLFVLTGVVRLAMPLADGGATVGRVEPGDYLGATALTREPVGVDAIATTEIALLEVPGEVVDELIVRRPRLARDLQDVIDRRRAEESPA